MDETGKIKLYVVDLTNEQDRKFWIISLNPQDFGNKRPAHSIVQVSSAMYAGQILWSVLSLRQQQRKDPDLLTRNTHQLNQGSTSDSYVNERGSAQTGSPPLHL
jgi:hypothetical protein